MTDEAPLERDRVALRRALIMGTARRPIDAPAWLAGEDAKASALALVAALGLRGRFDRPTPPAQLRRVGLAHEAPRLASDAARSALRRLYGAKKRSVQRAVTLRIVDALAERGLRLHPFDYPLLSDIIATNDDALDRNARLWQSLTSGAERAAPADEIDDANWSEFRPAQRAAFLRSRRRQDSKAARELLAAAIGGETASVRGQLLEAMATGLGADDVEFLRGLAGDRADSVRTLARALVARIAGTSELEERINAAHERLELKSVGIIGRRKVLLPKLPKGLADAKTAEWVADSFAGVSTEVLAARFKLSREELVQALSDERLRTVFFANALALGELETAAAIAASLELAEARGIAFATRDALAALEPSQRAAFWDGFAPALASGSLEERCVFAAELYEILRVPPPSSLLDPAKTTKPWKLWLETLASNPDRDQPEIPELVITLAHRTHRAAWRERCNDLPPATTSTALALADLFDALDLQSPPTT